MPAPLASRDYIRPVSDGRRYSVTITGPRVLILLISGQCRARVPVRQHRLYPCGVSDSDLWGGPWSCRLDGRRRCPSQVSWFLEQPPWTPHSRSSQREYNPIPHAIYSSTLAYHGTRPQPLEPSTTRITHDAAGTAPPPAELTRTEETRVRFMIKPKPNKLRRYVVPASIANTVSGVDRCRIRYYHMSGAPPNFLYYPRFPP